MSDLPEDPIPGTGINIPFEDVPGGPIMQGFPANMIVCGGVSYRSAFFEDGAGAKAAVLIFDFHTASGGQVPPIMLACEDEDLLRLPDEIRKAVRSAIKAAAS